MQGWVFKTKARFLKPNWLGLFVKRKWFCDCWFLQLVFLRIWSFCKTKTCRFRVVRSQFWLQMVISDESFLVGTWRKMDPGNGSLWTGRKAPKDYLYYWRFWHFDLPKRDQNGVHFRSPLCKDRSITSPAGPSVSHFPFRIPSLTRRFFCWF